MNKAQIIQNIAKTMTISKASVQRTVNAFLAEIQKGIKKDRAVQLVGFGTFMVRNRKARLGRNPKTGERIRIKASRTVGFKAGLPLKSSI